MKFSSPDKAAFTLVELMVSTAIIGLIMLVLVQMTNQTSATWKNATEKIEKFQQARDGFEAMTRRLSQATLNTYWDYLDKNGAPRDPNVQNAAFKNFIPYMYGRASQLRFLSGPMSSPLPPGATTVNSNDSALAIPASMPIAPADITRPGHGVFFQAPFGEVLASDAQGSGYGVMDNLLNTWGYFVEAGLDLNRPAMVDAAGVPTRWRSRLLEYRQPSESMSVYDPTDKTPKWATVLLPQSVGAARPVRVLAENILTLIILPKLSNADQDARAKTYGSSVVPLCPLYVYNSQLTQNPPASGGPDVASVNPKNQLPPIISVTMVAIDERSAERLDDRYKHSALMGMDQVVAKAGYNYSLLFNDSKKLEDDPTVNGTADGDLSKYAKALTNAGITYRIFTTNVTIRGAKWSRAQSK